jgi:hypothetical protein
MNEYITTTSNSKKNHNAIVFWLDKKNEKGKPPIKISIARIFTHLEESGIGGEGGGVGGIDG